MFLLPLNEFTMCFMSAVKLVILLILVSPSLSDDRIWSWDSLDPHLSGVDRVSQTPIANSKIFRNNGLFSFSSSKQSSDPWALIESRSPFRFESENESLLPSMPQDEYDSSDINLTPVTEYPEDDWMYRHSTVGFHDSNSATERTFDHLPIDQPHHPKLVTSPPMSEANIEFDQDDIDGSGSTSYPVDSNFESESGKDDSSSLRHRTQEEDSPNDFSSFRDGLSKENEGGHGTSVSKETISSSSEHRLIQGEVESSGATDSEEFISRASIESRSVAEEDSIGIPALEGSSSAQTTYEEDTDEIGRLSIPRGKSSDVLSSLPNHDLEQTPPDTQDRFSLREEIEESSGWGSGYSPEPYEKLPEEFASESGYGETDEGYRILESAGKNKAIPAESEKDLENFQWNSKEKVEVEPEKHIMVIGNPLKTTIINGHEEISPHSKNPLKEDKMTLSMGVNYSLKDKDQDDKGDVFDETDSGGLKIKDFPVVYNKWTDAPLNKSPFIMTIKASNDKNRDWEAKKSLEAEGFVYWKPSPPSPKEIKTIEDKMSPNTLHDRIENFSKDIYEGSGTIDQHEKIIFSEGQIPVVHQKRSENSRTIPAGLSHQVDPSTKTASVRSDQVFGPSTRPDGATPMLFLLSSPLSNHKVSPYGNVPLKMANPPEKEKLEDSESLEMPKIRGNDNEASDSEMLMKGHKRYTRERKRSRGEQLVADLLESLRDTAIDIASTRSKRRQFRNLSISNVARAARKSFS